MKCNYCFAGFTKVKSSLNLNQQKKIIQLLREKGFEKINFVGGEPFLGRNFEELIIYAKQLGFYTSIVTNGSLIRDPFLNKVHGYIDMIGISVDSLNLLTNKRIGRYSTTLIPDKTFYLHLCNKIINYGINVKINTVVSNLNLYEDFNEFINYIKPVRWKVFQVLGVLGENNIMDTKITSSEFEDFITRHDKSKNYLIAESNNIMSGSYIMIDPQGCFYDNTKGGYTVSSPIHKVGVNYALNQINFDLSKFRKRDGNYYENLTTNKITI